MIDLKSVKRFDFNTLPIFLCVYKHVSVLKAAEELQLTSPNITHALNKLRKYFNDPLFIRVGQKLSPTPYCKQLYKTISNDFENLCSSIAAPKLKSEVVIYSPDVVVMDLLSNNMDDGSFPKIVHHNTIVDPETASELFSFRKADMVITHEPVYSSAIKSVHLSTLEGVVVCSRHHPRLSELLDATDIDEKLNKESWVTLNTDYILFNYIRKKTELSSMLENRKVVFESSTQNMCLWFIENSAAVGYMSTKRLNEIEPLRREKLVELPAIKIFVDIYINYKITNDENVNRVFGKIVGQRV